MSDFIKKIRTLNGDKQIDYNALANLPDLSQKVSKSDVETELDSSSTNPISNGAVTEAIGNLGAALVDKVDKITISTSEDGSYIFEFSNTHNTEKRLSEVTNISFTFGNGEYVEDYTSGLSFDSGETPTSIDYTDSGILNWVGTDCTTSDGLSIFQPSENTHYDIVFYFNGVQFIGLVNGFVPANGNVVSE